VACSPDGKRLVSGSYDSTLKVWDADKGTETLSLKGHTLPISCVLYSPDGKRIVSGSEDRTLKVWDADTGQDLLTLKGHPGAVFCVLYSPDGKRIVSGSGGYDPKTSKRWGEVKVWDAQTGQELLTLKDHPEWVTRVAYSPDGKQVFGRDSQGKVLAWDAATGHLLPDSPAQMPAAAGQATSPDGRLRVRFLGLGGAAVVERLTDRPRDEHPERAPARE
jgi:WD40 repeat protein